MPAIAGAKDLTVVAPQALDCEIEGYAWIPRMLDKARATLAGTNGSYMFGCPVDHTCMARLGVGPELILELAGRFADDSEVLRALHEHGIPPASEAWFDGPAVEDELQDLDLYVRVRATDQLPATADGAVFAGADHGASVSVSLLTLEPAGTQPPHAHPVEEVLVVIGGTPTVFLGARQARTLRPREIARIPANCLHRIENRTDAPAECVLAYGSSNLVTDRG